MDILMCEVCEKNEAVGVANCSLAQPCSHAYCRECLRHRADPLWCYLAAIEICGGPEALAEWVQDIHSYKEGKYLSFKDVLELYQKSQ